MVFPRWISSCGRLKFIYPSNVFHTEKELSTKEETKRPGSSQVLQGQPLNCTFIDLPHLSDSTNQPEPAATGQMSLDSSAFRLSLVTGLSSETGLGKADPELPRLSWGYLVLSRTLVQ